MKCAVIAMFVSTGALAAEPKLDCVTITGAEEVLVPGAHVLVGEMHGNDVTPKAVGELACIAARRGPVRVALEIPTEEQPRLDAFLASAGKKEDQARLLAGKFWTPRLQDGRRSVAVVALLERLRALSKQGARVGVTAYDAIDGERDQAMSERLRLAFEAAPKDTFIVLTGNLHARKTSGSMGRTFMAQALTTRGVATTSLMVRTGSGGSWVCSGFEPATCGPQPTGKGPGQPLGLRLEKVDGGAYDGWLDLGVPTWSPPATTKPTPEQLKNIEVYSVRLEAMRAYDTKAYAACGDAFARLSASSDDPYSAACCYALGGEADKAFAELRRMVQLGFADAPGLEGDDDLKSLRSDARWQPIVTQVRAARQ